MKTKKYFISRNEAHEQIRGNKLVLLARTVLQAQASIVPGRIMFQYNCNTLFFCSVTPSSGSLTACCGPQPPPGADVSRANQRQ
jgi:hypothetical protein